MGFFLLNDRVSLDHAAMHRFVRSLLESWSIKCGNKMMGEIWKMILRCISWTLWKERNTRAFEDSEASIGLSSLTAYVCYTIGMLALSPFHSLIFS